jgi:hypothetical protein
MLVSLHAARPPCEALPEVTKASSEKAWLRNLGKNNGLNLEETEETIPGIPNFFGEKNQDICAREKKT